MKLPKEKDEEIQHTCAFVQDRRFVAYVITPDLEAGFDEWSATGEDDGRFDDYRVSPPGAIYTLMFISPPSVN